MSEICREFFEAYHNVFHDDYHSWNSPLTRSSESFSECLVYVCVCVCVSVCACFVYLHQYYFNNLVLQHLINRYMTFTSELFLKIKDIVKSKFLILVNYGRNLKKRGGDVVGGSS